MRSDFGYFEEKQLGKPYDLKLLARLYPYTQPYKLLLAASIVLVVFITLLDLSLPYVTKIAIDRYIVPKIESTGGQGQGPVEGSIRYLKADLADPGIRAVVEKHPHLFKIHGDWATIPYDDLTKLSKKDLGTLRKNDLAGVAWIAAVFLAIVLMNFVFNMAQVLIMEYTGQMIMHDLRVRLFNHIQGLSVSFFTRNPVGRLVRVQGSFSAGGDRGCSDGNQSAACPNFFYRHSLCRLGRHLFFRSGPGSLQNITVEDCRDQHPIFRNHRGHPGDPALFAGAAKSSRF